MQQIADEKGCSLNKVDYWMRKYEITRRNLSDAVYARHNPHGDPFSVKTHLNRYECELFGMGIGLYWGEGTKANKSSVRLGNSDPGVILKFIEFLEIIYGVKRSDMRCGMQLFTDCSFEAALQHWIGFYALIRLNFTSPHVRYLAV